MNKSFAKKTIRYTIIFCLFFFISAFLFFIFQNPLAQRSQIFNYFRINILKTGIAQHFLPTYHSLRKLPNILFTPYYLFPSQLSSYSLYISPENIAFLNSNLPEDPIGGYLYNENKTWVKAVFVAENYNGEVKVRYRGTNANHWNSFQKSLRVQFPSENLFNGMKDLDFIIAYDRGYFADPLNLYRAKKLGLTVLDMNFSRLNLNGVDMGVYLVVERWSDELVQRMKGPEALAIFNFDDGRNINKNTETKGFLVKRQDSQDYFINHTSSVFDDNIVEIFYDIIERTDDKIFKRVIPNIIDIKKFYAFNVVSILSGSSHFSDDFGNIFLIFNPATGKFEISPWDLGMKSADITRSDHLTRLSSRILSIPEFRQERNKLLAWYIQNELNLEDDLAFYDNLLKKTKRDFFTDNAKLYNNFQFLIQTRLIRDIIVENFNKANAALSYGDDYYADFLEVAPESSSVAFGGTFKRFFESGYSIDEFMTNNPAFIKGGAKMIILPSGSYAFYRDVIVPANLRMVIDAGTTIYMGKNVSFLSYSPIIASTDKSKPIRILRASPSEAWGTFAVVNTENDKNVFNYVQFNGGSGAKINGITFTGMVAFHNSDADIKNSSFINAGDDDGLNIKYGRVLVENSYFSQNFSDGIDIDFSDKETKIINNQFIANGYGGGGDGIDLSWSDILIEGNKILTCTDKGISIGESSNSFINNNEINGCDIGIAVKDLSKAEIENNIISDVRVGIAVYRKKDVFGGAEAYLKGNIIKSAKIDYEKDDLSKINIL